MLVSEYAEEGQTYRCSECMAAPSPLTSRSTDHKAKSYRLIMEIKAPTSEYSTSEKNKYSGYFMTNEDYFLKNA